MKKKLLFVITQLYKGGAEMALLNLFKNLSPDEYEVDLLIHDQVYIPGYVCLIDSLPSWIKICNASQGEGKLVAYGKKAIKKIILHTNKRLLSRKSAKQFIKYKRYDIAFNYGEWMSPEFVAIEVKADRKYNWIHNDLNKVDYLDPKVFWPWDKYYDGYIFVSKASMRESCSVFPNLKDRCHVIHNLCDEHEILRLSNEPMALTDFRREHFLVTVANFRKQKNHLRQLEVMKNLVDNGCKLTWLNIGGNADFKLFRQLKEKIQDYELENSFLLMQSEPNPYKYMMFADAVMVLSDYESWSLVITEAKVLGVPVITTPTSGALEQIVHEVNGIIVETDVVKIANAIQNYLVNPSLRKRLQKNLENFSPSAQTFSEWDKLIGGK